ncbi:MAG: response regulator [bacterium]|nr:response regulator [bacterium]
MKDLVLIIDDDQSVLAAFTRILRKEKFVASTLSQLENAMDYISIKKPRVVIIDLKIPGNESIELIRQIKRMFNNIYIIIMTAYSNSFTERDAIELGADVYLKKPFEVSFFLSKLYRLVDQN